jgi:hypothetical protein
MLREHYYVNVCPLSGPYEVFVTGSTKWRFETLQHADYYVKVIVFILLEIVLLCTKSLA